MIDDLWYKHAVIYCLDVGTFMDSNADGVGDFEGLTRRLDYLSGLGITALWLLPFQPGPDKDNGYDITDYYGVDSRHGSLGDFVDFTHEAKKRGIRVIIDLVINHTSNKHPWFLDARKSKTSKYRDWYVWSKKKPKSAHRGMVFPGVQDRTWTFDPVAREYYFHRFYEHMPDLNTENHDVQTEILRVMGFWLQLGVDGFRVDALPFVLEDKGPGPKGERRFEALRRMRQFLQWRRGDAILLAEANVLPEQNVNYFGTPDDRVHMMFNFYVNQHLFLALATGDTRPLAMSLRKTKKRPETAQWANFLRNNDELDLGRLTKQQRKIVFKKFGPDKSMQLYDRGIRRRLSPMLKGNRKHIELAYSVMMTLPGTPVLRYGDEIGMGDDLSLPERHCVRTPMQWSDEPQGGFSKATKTTLPVIDDEVYGYQRLNAAVQRRDQESLLNFTERLIRMRKECQEIGWGEFDILTTRNPAVLAICYKWRGNSLVVVHNFHEEPQAVKIDIGEDTLVSLFTNDHSKSKSGVHTIALDGYDFRWFRVGGLAYLLERER